MANYTDLFNSEANYYLQSVIHLTIYAFKEKKGSHHHHFESTFFRNSFLVRCTNRTSKSWTLYVAENSLFVKIILGIGFTNTPPHLGNF